MSLDQENELISPLDGLAAASTDRDAISYFFAASLIDTKSVAASEPIKMQNCHHVSPLSQPATSLTLHLLFVEMA